MTIRQMCIHDYDTVKALWEATPGMGLNSYDDSCEGIQRFLQRNPSTNFVAVNEQSQLIGTILCGHDGRRGAIYHTAVLPSWQGQGVGRSLVNAACHALRAEGIYKVKLVAFRTNALGNGFWRSLGWTVRSDLVYYDMTLEPSSKEENPQ